MLGYNDEEVLDLHTWDWEANMSEKEIKGNFADLSKTRAVFETIHRRKDGSTYFAEVSASGAMVHGESMVFTVTRDITERKEAKRIKSEFDAQKQVVKRLEELDRMKDEFVSTVTHELRTPMTPLKSTIEMLLDGSLGEITPEQKKFVEMMGRNVERLAQFTTEVLTLSRLESRRYRLAPKTLSLLQAMEPVMELMNAKAGSRKSKIILDVAPELCVYADEDSLGMVVTNLTNNAIVHTPKQSQITVSARQVADDRVEVSVSDNGEGIPEEHLGRLFDRFYQAKRRDSAQYKGTGIGLAVCKALVEAMGGEISVESQLGEGTTFRFTLPAQSENPSKEE
jgi:two-component system OmpR family sensor kinase